MSNILIHIIFFVFSSVYKIISTLSTISLDLGCEYLKIGLAQPSLPISLATDQYGEMIISSSIYIKDDKTLFGSAAYNMMQFDPINVYINIPCLIGKPLYDEYLQNYKRQFPYYSIHEDTITKSFYFINRRNETYFVEELLSLILDNILKIADERIKKMYPNRYFSDAPFKFRTLIIAVPINYQQKEKIILLKACEMVNISVLQLLESNTAAFITLISKYLKLGVETGSYGILDIGVDHVQMTLASIQKIKSTYKAYSFDSSKIKIMSSSFLPNVGVNTVINNMQKYFLEEIQKDTISNSKIPLNDSIFISRLYLGCKELLRRISSVPYSVVTLKGLYHEKDFNLSMNSLIISYLLNNTLNGIVNVIKSTLQNVKEFWIIPKGVAVIGGGRYLPFVEKIIQSSLNKVPLLKVLDPFSTVAWGSVYEASNIAPGFFNFPIIIPKKTFKTLKIVINTITKVMKMTFIPQQFKFISSVILKKIKQNFNFSVFYEPLATEGNPSLIPIIPEPILLHNIYVHNLEESIAKMDISQKEGSSNFTIRFKGVDIKYSSDINSLISLESVSALFVKIITFNISTLENSDDLLNTSSRIVINNTRLELLIIKLNYSVKFPYPTLMKENMEKMIQRIHKIKIKNKEFFEKEAVRNELQYYVSDLKRKFNEKDYIICTTDLERRKIWSFLDDTSRWMKLQNYEEIQLNEYFQKFDYLINLTKHIDIRVHEIRNRPILLKRLQIILDTTQHFIMNMLLTSESGESSKGIFTKNETKELRTLNKETRIWLNDLNKKLQSIEANDDPHILCNDIIEKITILENTHNQLLELMEKRIDPNQKNQGPSDQILLEDSNDKRKCNESNTCSETDKSNDKEKENLKKNVNNSMEGKETIPHVLYNKKENVCGKQDNDDEGEKASNKECQNPK